jgi:hypothetical protein
VKKAGLIALALVSPTLLVVRTIVRYNEQTAQTERLFGTPEERAAATERIITSQNSAEAAGASAGAHETEQGCLDKGFDMERRGPPQYSRLMFFLEGCLAAAKPTPGFCNDIPPYSATMSPEAEARSRAYQYEICRKQGLNNLDCRANTKMIQLHCHPIR